MPPVVEQLRDYRLLDKLGEGGMGAVYRGLHLRLQRPVAIKILSSERITDSQAIARFQREMQAVGRLDHPHIVRATDAGEDQGVHFLVMELVEGLNLSQYLHRFGGKLDIPVACEVIRQTALGLQHVHENQLVHRDIKPSNLMITGKGLVKILDLGLAQLRPTADRTAAPALTSEGMVMGTMDYVAPEQLTAPQNVDIRADIYSLGCTLYQTLTGRVPFPDASIAEKIAAHQLTEPDSLERLRHDLPPGLAQVVQRMMAKKPHDRFPTPLAVAQALRPFCQRTTEVYDVPPDARPSQTQPVTQPTATHSASRVTVPMETQVTAGSPTLQMPRKSSRRPWLVGGLVAVPVLALCIYFAVPSSERTPGDNVPPEQTSPQANPSPTPVPGEPPIVPVVQEEASDPVGPIINLAGHGYPVSSVAFAPDGLTAVTCSAWETVVWDLKKRKLQGKTNEGLGVVVFTPDGKYRVCGHGQLIGIFDVAANQQSKSIASTSNITCLAMARDGSRIVVGDDGGGVTVRELPSGSEVHRFQQQHVVTAVDLSPDNSTVVFGDNRGRVVVWNLLADRQERQLEGHNGKIEEVRFTADGKQVWTGAGYSGTQRDNTMRQWDVRTGKELRNVAVVGDKWITCVALSPDLRRALVGLDGEGVLFLVDLKTGKTVETYSKHQGSILSVAFSAGGRLALSGGTDGVVWFYRLPD